ncbi:dioxygenase family protein [Lentzea tibetensis]|uniref:dioxygenase family protein n=1 Tax=Lentzea tibetensis TaxID=2591470 RepID=UPI001C996314|nr:dioxygenase [Lentzea tibetensis]
MPPQEPTSRRAFIKTGALGVTSVAIAAAAGSAEPALAAPRPADAPLPITPSCSGHETPSSVEGPLFKPNSPERTNLVTPAITGVLLALRGVIYDRECKPLPGVLIDFWQCDQNGDYDEHGFSLRGHQLTDSAGAYRLDTIVPRDYWGRWGRRGAHIHVQVQAPNGPVLVTQLYFPDDTQAYGRNFAAHNAGDQFFNRACVVTLGPKQGNRYAGRFDFVIKTTA